MIPQSRTVSIGQYALPNLTVVAPMAGVTDRPFRLLCRRLGAGHAVSEMAASNPRVWNTVKSARRLDHQGEPAPVAVQIAGGDPALMAQAARFNVARGAQIIDINMGCPVKKVCNTAAGSALLRDESLVARIIGAVVDAVAHEPVPIPVTLKYRTGWDQENRNAVRIALLAESLGVSMLALHGRTRADLYLGQAEYGTIREVKACVRIPVVANGDIDSPHKALAVLRATNADAVMIGRAAQGRPWIFREINHFLRSGRVPLPPRVALVRRWLLEHLADHYAFYGEMAGVRTARKHIGWYTAGLQGACVFRARMNALESTAEQYAAVDEFFAGYQRQHERLQYAGPIELAA